MRIYRVDAALRGPCEERLMLTRQHVRAENETLAAIEVGGYVRELLRWPERWRVASVKIQDVGEAPEVAYAAPALDDTRREA